MKVLVTGANGFVGRWMLRGLLEAGHDVTGAAGPLAPPGRETGPHDRLDWMPLDLRDGASAKAAAAAQAWDAVVHLAGAASAGASIEDPGAAWEINAAGTARLLAALGRERAERRADPVVLVVSTSDVYGSCDGRPVTEQDAIAPRSPYAASKVGAEVAARETALRTGLRTLVARPFPHTGPGQDARFVVPAFASRLLEARRSGARTVRVGNLDVTRDFLDVRDVTAAYLALLEKGVPGEVYNIASGRAVKLSELFAMLAKVVGVDAAPEADPVLTRAVDVSYLVGDAGRLRQATGWSPRYTLEETLRELVHAQAN